MNMNPSSIQAAAAISFALAIVHTFMTKQINELSHRFAKGSIGARLLHILGEVEVVFAIWSGVLLTAMAAIDGPKTAANYLASRNFNEAVFVFVILVVCATRPVLDFAEFLIDRSARLLPLPRSIAFFASCLTIGPVLGSFITEPAAMTVTALLLNKHFLHKDLPLSLKYAALGVLFVNVSIGGTLTPFAAPPILMVAGTWGWGLREMITMFGWKGVLACVLSTAFVTVRFRRELSTVHIRTESQTRIPPAGIQAAHVVLLAAVVASAHHPLWLAGLFSILVIFTRVTQKFQDPLQLKSGALVALFLAGLVVLGGQQTWWLEPLISGLDTLTLYLGAMALTAVTDNAALTYLGSLIPELTGPSRYALVAGAVVGGGLTVIANAPNPAGYSILRPSFGEDGISPLGLFLAALPPTAVAAVIFWLL